MSDKDVFDDAFIACFKLVFGAFLFLLAAPFVLAFFILTAIIDWNRNRPTLPEPLPDVSGLPSFPDSDTVVTNVVKKMLEEHGNWMPHFSIFAGLQSAFEEVYRQEELTPPAVTPALHGIEAARQRDAYRAYAAKVSDTQLIPNVEAVFLDVLERVNAVLPPMLHGTAIELRDYEPKGLQVPVIDVLPNPVEVVEAVIHPFCNPRANNLFDGLKEQFDRNVCAVSKLPFTEENRTSVKLIMPRKFTGSPREMADAYLADTPFSGLLQRHVSFEIPKSAWQEHAFILGASGSGKTQLLQSLILDWLKEPDPPSLIIVDSQGDMLNKIERLALFDGALADRLIIIDPEDDEPPSLNMFDMQTPRLAGYSRNVREQVEASVIELYTYLFGALDSTLTSKQSTAFTYVARLMLSIPDATIHTFRALMEETGKGQSQFAPHIAKLDTTAREFFERQFFTSAFAETRQQVARRLYDFLRVPAFDRIFSAPRNTLDMFEALQAGKIVLVNTSKSLLKSASPLFGRYMIMQVLAAAYERVAIPEAERRPAFLIVDEAHEYFDKTLEDILTQCRKYRVGLICANQTLDQCAPDIRSTLISNTSIKLMGGLSDRDAKALAPDMRTMADFLSEAGKESDSATFSCFVRNYTPRSIHLDIAFGVLEEEPKMSAAAHRRLRAKNRETYSYHPTVVVADEDASNQSSNATMAPATDVAPRSPAVDPAW